MSLLLRVDEDPLAVQQAAEIIVRGGVVAYPTDTLYGLGASIFNDKAVERIYEIKGRDHTKPLLIVVRDEEMLAPLVREIPESARRLMDAFWPGPLTLVFHASPSMPGLCLAGGQTVAVRVPDSTVTLSLLSETDVPLTSSSANFSGGEEPVSAEQVLAELGDRVDLILDGGPCSDQRPSTIVDVSGNRPTLLREGRISRGRMEPFLG